MNTSASVWLIGILVWFFGPISFLMMFGKRRKV